MTLPATVDNYLTAEIARQMPRVPWPEFYNDVFAPEIGEHIAILGPTGNGKTYLTNALLPKYPFVALFATKAQDVAMEALIKREGYARLAQWRALSVQDYPRRVLWPNASSINAEEHQKQVFSDALGRIFRERGRPAHKPVGWTLGIDEFWFVANQLGMWRQLQTFMFQGRSLGHTLIAATQRPSEVPVGLYTSATHLFFFRFNDARDVKRLGEINMRSSGLVTKVVTNLEAHQVLYVNTRTGRMARTRTPHPNL